MQPWLAARPTEPSLVVPCMPYFPQVTYQFGTRRDNYLLLNRTSSPDKDGKSKLSIYKEGKRKIAVFWDREGCKVSHACLTFYIGS